MDLKNTFLGNIFSRFGFNNFSISLVNRSTLSSKFFPQSKNLDTNLSSNLIIAIIKTNNL